MCLKIHGQQYNQLTEIQTTPLTNINFLNTHITKRRRVLACDRHKNVAELNNYKWNLKHWKNLQICFIFSCLKNMIIKYALQAYGTTGWLWIRIICQSEATCLPADCCLSELALQKSNYWHTCWSGTKWTLSSFDYNLFWIWYTGRWKIAHLAKQ